DYLVAAYDVLHTLSLEYVAEDVIELMKKKGYDFAEVTPKSWTD
ncbi:MAG: DUF3791 domain-containing protein, partial [Muribaculaceae bacterium]|nr:DUF3791 domain-containing protein [Muribaculaceae bacterium]